MTGEQREQLEAIAKCDPSWLLMDIKDNSVFDAAVIEKVFDLAKDQARALLSASIADTAGAKPIYQECINENGLWMDTSEQTYTDILNGKLSSKGARIVCAAPPAPSVADALPRFDDPRAQTVYELICDGQEPPKGEHWDGFVARRIVDALSAAGASEGQAPVAWMRQYMSYPDSPEDAPGYMVTDFHQNAVFASKYPAENKPLYTHPSAELTALRERVAGMEKDAELGAYVRRLHGSLGRQTEALYDNIEHAIQEQK